MKKKGLSLIIGRPSIELQSVFGFEDDKSSSSKQS